jgi:hypothetical protein
MACGRWPRSANFRGISGCSRDFQPLNELPPAVEPNRHPVHPLLCVAYSETQNNPEARAFSLHHRLQAFGPACDHAIERKRGGHLAGYGTVEQLPVRRPPGVVDGNRIGCTTPGRRRRRAGWIRRPGRSLSRARFKAEAPDVAKQTADAPEAAHTEFIDTPGRSYDISRDGQRLLVVKRARPVSSSKINLIVNGFDALARTAGTQ